MATIYNIPHYNWDRLLDRVEKITRRAKKLGRAVPILTKIGETEQIVDIKRGTTQVIYRVTIESERIEVSGWTFVASIDVSDDPEVGRIVRRVPGVLEDRNLMEYRKTEGFCQHCNVKRRRNSVFVLWNEKTDEFKQVGRNCLADFLGGVDPEEYVKYMEIAYNLDELCSGAQGHDFFGFGGCDYKLDLRSTLIFTNFVISKHGWLSRSKARELRQDGRNVEATADYVQHAFTTLPAYQSPTVTNLVEEFDSLTEADRARFEVNVEEAIDWIRSTDDELNNDYLHNLYVCCKSDSFDKKHIGLVCSLGVAYANTQGRLERAEACKNLVHIGTLNKRENFTLKVTDVKYWQNNFGGVTAVFFEDSNGNKAIWKATSNPDLNIGDCYSLQGTVKAHDDYKGTPQTVLNRCRVLANVGGF